MASLVGSPLFKPVRTVAKAYLFNSTLKVFREALAADSVADATEVFLASASRENGELWMDIMVLVAALMMALLLSNCMVRMFCWVCVGVPRQTRELNKMRKGELPYQEEARKAKKEKRQRQKAGLEESPASLASDMQQLQSAMSEVRGRLSAKGVDVREPAMPSMPPTSAEGAAAARDEYKPTNHRHGPATAPASTLRGFPEVDILIASPSQRYLLVSCRSKRLTLVFPQGSDSEYVKQGKKLSAEAKEGEVSCVERALSAVLASERPPEVYSAAFTPDDGRVVVGERNTDQIFAFTVSSAKAELSLLWSFKMPDKRLVSLLPRWNMMNTETLVTMTSKDCEVETITYKANGTAQTHKDRFKVGAASAWAQVGEQIGIAGSFLREPRIAKMVTRANTGATTLETVSLFPNPLKLRVTALALVVKGVPAFNTRSYFIVFLESGECSVYDVESLSQSNTPVVCTAFVDTDFAGYNAGEPLRMIACVAGKAYQERLLLGIYRGWEKITVYAQAGQSHGATFVMNRVVDIFRPQDGGAVKEAVFIQNGRGIATCGVAGGHQVRLFAVPPP